jgi:hypothetical protein
MGTESDNRTGETRASFISRQPSKKAWNRVLMWGGLGSNKNMELMRAVLVSSAKPLGTNNRNSLYFGEEIPARFRQMVWLRKTPGMADWIADRSSAPENGLVR